MMQKRFTRGFSLVELMIALVIGMLLLTGLVSIVVNSSQSYGEVDKISRQMENGRYALSLLLDDIQHAGFYGEYSGAQDHSLPAALPNPCDFSVANLNASLVLPVQGYDSPGASPLGCVQQQRPNTDILVIRRASNTIPLPARPNLQIGQVYIQTASSTGRPATAPAACAAASTVGYILDIADAADDADFCYTYVDGSLMNTRELRTDIYYVSSCSNAACNDDLPTLKRVELQVSGGALSWTTVPLVEGIEDMQLDYGLDDGSAGGIANDGSPDRYVTDPGTVADWQNVVTIRVSLLTRNIDMTVGYEDTKVYNLGLTQNIAPDANALNYKRHVFGAVARLVNPSAVRE